MRISYKKLWIMCAENEMSKQQLRELSGLAPSTFTKLRQNKEVSLSALMKIAKVLNCNIGDMLDFIPFDSSSQDNEKNADLSVCGKAV